MTRDSLSADALEVWRQADAAFDRLLDTPAAERIAALESMHLAPPVQKRVFALLQADTDSVGMLDAQMPAPSTPASPLRGRRFGRWTLCDELGIVLIFDEVQTGLGRTGNWFFAGSELADAVVPDIVTLAKSLGSGIPVGACLVNNCISESIKLNDLGTTFGGGMIAMAAVLATVEAIEAANMVANAKTVEHHLRDSLSGVPEVVAVRGKGCLLGIEFAEPCSPIHKKLLGLQIITGTSSNPYVLRLLPPLSTNVDEINLLVEVLSNR